MKKYLESFSQQINLKQAILVSCLFHLMVLILVSYLFRVSLTSPITRIQSVLDFVFEPGRDEFNILSEETVQEVPHRKKPVQSANLRNKAKAFPKPPNRSTGPAEEEEKPGLSKLADLSVPRQTWNRPVNSERNGLFDISNSDVINRLSRTNISPKIRFTPKISSATYPISEKRQKKLQKKLFDLMEKIYDTDFRDTSFTWHDHDQPYRMTITREIPQDPTDQEDLWVHIATQDHGNRVTTELKMRRMAFSNFAHFIDVWDPRVAVHNDEIDGRFHSNTNFSISRSNGIKPKFTGKVTTAGYEVKNAGSFPIFNFESIFAGGLETGVKQILFPKNFSPISRDSSKNRLSIHRISGESWITFLADGTYDFREKQDQKTVNKRIPQDRSHFILGQKKSKIHLCGTLRGKVLVYSLGKILIDDDLLYTQNPQIFEYSGDYLGIVSQNDVEIAHPSVTGSGDLTIYGAVYAKKRFRIPNRRKNGDATLFIYGSLSAGSISATEPRYATKVVFDQRFEKHRPPNFPLTNRYEIIKWKKDWEVQPPKK